MRYSLRTTAFRKTKTRIISLTTALVLAVTGMGGIMPLVLSETASAAAATYSDVPLTSGELSANWGTDRSTPSGGYTSTTVAGHTDTLQLNVNNTAANTSSTFYQTEGLKRSIPSSDSIKADLYLDSNWSSRQVRAGLWGVGADSSSAVSAYPIVEYTANNASDGGYTGWRVYDSMVGTWSHVSASTSSTWHTVTISLNQYQSTFGVFIDGNLVGTSPTDGTTTHLSEAIFNSYNYATGNHVDDYSVNWSNFAYGSFPTSAPTEVYVDASLTDPFVDDLMYGYDAFTNIQDGIDAVAAGGTVYVAAGTYQEDVNVNKDITVVGDSADNTTIVGTTGNTTPLTFSSNNATVSGFTITHDYTAGELSAWNFNNNGVIFLQGTTGNTLCDSVVTLNRNGVYINNAQGNTVTNNVITNNRTGLNVTNNIDNTEISDNEISNNWTIGLVMYTATPALTTNLSTVTVSGNTFDQNWYSEFLVKDANFSGTLDLNDNTFTDSPVTYSTSNSTSLNEPGFAAQHPVDLGGTAVKPSTDLPTIRIYNSPNVNLLYTTDGLDVGSDDLVLTSDEVVVTVPQNAVITPANAAAWNGIITAPHVVTSGVNLPGGTTSGIAIEVGSNGTTLTFDQAVKLVFPGQAGKRVGWQSPGSSSFTEITTVCGANDSATVNAQLEALEVNECKINSGSDLVVWTNHFTTFATFTTTPTSTGGSSSSSSSSSTAPTTTTVTKYVATTSSSDDSNAAAKVLGAAAGIAALNTIKNKAADNNKAATTTNDSSNFLGLGWWWLLVLAGVALLVAYLIAARRSDNA